MNIIKAPLPEGPDALVGVYGTLKKGMKRFGALDKSKPMGSALLKGVIMLHKGDYPVLLEAPERMPYMKESHVALEVYKVTIPTMETLDAIEGHPDLFQRKIITSPAFGEVWVYFGNAEHYLKGYQRVIVSNYWNGPNSTHAIEVNFGDGTGKPKISLKASKDLEKIVERVDVDDTFILNNALIDGKTGEIIRFLKASDFQKKYNVVTVKTDDTGEVAEASIDVTGTAPPSVPAVLDPEKYYQYNRFDKDKQAYLAHDGTEICWCYLKNRWMPITLAVSQDTVNAKLINDWIEAMPKPETITVPKGKVISSDDTEPKVLTL